MEPWLLIALSLVVGLVAIFVLFSGSKSSGSTGSGSALTLVGEMGSGKTALFVTLTTGKFAKTYTSMAPNEAALDDAPTLAAAPAAKSLKLVDLPGHGRYRFLFPSAFARSRAVVFTVDATNASAFKQAAALLYSVLTDPALYARRVPVIVACTKSSRADTAVLPVARVTADLEAALDTLRKIRSSSREMESLDGEKGQKIILGETLSGPTFTFADSACPVQVVAVSSSDGDLSGLVGAIGSALAA